VAAEADRKVGVSVGVSVGAVSKALARAAAAELTWEAAQTLDDHQLEALMYPSVEAAAARPEPDCTWIHRERHRPGVTLELLHHEYLERYPAGLRYTMFCERYREWLGRRGLVMRQVHIAGDMGFFDYSGKKARIVDATTGEVTDVEIFVAEPRVHGRYIMRTAAMRHDRRCGAPTPSGLSLRRRRATIRTPRRRPMGREPSRAMTFRPRARRVPCATSNATARLLA
jgi:hypothetical protein